MAKESNPKPPPPIRAEEVRTGLELPALRQAFTDHLRYTLGSIPATVTPHDQYLAVAYTVRDRLIARWAASLDTLLHDGGKVVSYLSAEFLIGPQLACNLFNLGIFDEVADAMRANGHDPQALFDLEPEPGLGNGGLGRLAACYMESLATLEIPAVGYGIRYEFGIFDQAIQDGRQVEITDKWLRYGNPWEIAHPQLALEVKLGGRTEGYTDAAGHYRVRWVAGHVVKGVPCDTPILGYRVNTCNTLRLWKAEAMESFDFAAFNTGDYYGAVDSKMMSENLTKVLYPNDESVQGKRLRLEQQYFFVSCSLQDMLRIYLRVGKKLEFFSKHFAIQLNDTHPSIGVAELMRLLVDEHDMAWDAAWEITRNTFAYTNHTLLPEALETWPVELLGSTLPRHLEIIYEINQRFLDEVRQRFPGDEARIARMSLIDETHGRRVRMAHLATVGSHKVNGVAELHSELLKSSVLRDFFELWPEKFDNITNGVTPRRFVGVSNYRLSQLLKARIGKGWLKDLGELRALEQFADDPEFQQEWRAAKHYNKQRLAALIEVRTGHRVDPASMFDLQVKRLHEYKRQHLNLLHVITLYRRLKNGQDIAPRTVIFGGKAAPGYFMAKLIIRLINGVAKVVNSDPVTRGRLKVVFFPNFNVKNAHFIYPAADLSEQISTAGKEASGTGNMKFTLNGALTIGTLDGANVEIREEVGADNFFLFGLDAAEVARRKTQGYNPYGHYQADEELRQAIDLIADGTFSDGDTNLFRPLVENLLYQDDYLLLADYRAYVDCQGEVDKVWHDQQRWTRMSILNVARAGKFSSDRAIREYCERIWQAQPLPISL